MAAIFLLTNSQFETAMTLSCVTDQEGKSTDSIDIRIKEVIAQLLDDFKKPDSLERVAAHVIPRSDVPCEKWSLLNRLLVELSHSTDCRGFQQWRRVGRQVKRGTKAVRILAPRLVKVVKKTQDEKGHEKEEERRILKGWCAIAVFRFEDTIGMPLKLPSLEPPSPPPLMHVAERFGIRVKYGAFLGNYYGSFSQSKSLITLASHDATVFFHELAHAISATIATPRRGQDPVQEIVAEFVAAVLSHLYGMGGEGNAYDYILSYARRLNREPIAACLQFIGRAEKVLKLILQSDSSPVPVRA